MPLCSCSEACCQPSWHPSNQIHSKNLTPNLLDAAWPRVKDVGPCLQSLVKRLKDTGSKAKHTMPHKSIPHSPNGHRSTPSEWNSFLGLGFSVILSNNTEGHMVCVPCSQPCQLLGNQPCLLLTGVGSSDSVSFLIASPDHWLSVKIPRGTMLYEGESLLQLAVCSSYYHSTGFMCLEGSVLIWTCLFKSLEIDWFSHSIIVISELSMQW